MNGSELLRLHLTSTQAATFADDAIYTLEHEGFKYFRARVFQRSQHGDVAMLTFTYEKRQELN